MRSQVGSATPVFFMSAGWRLLNYASALRASTPPLRANDLPEHEYDCFLGGRDRELVAATSLMMSRWERFRWLEPQIQSMKGWYGNDSFVDGDPG